MNKLKIAKSSELKWIVGVFLVFSGPIVIIGGYFLIFFHTEANLREVVSRKVYRSAQPSPAQLKDWVRRYGIRTVVNLRGDAGKITKDVQVVTSELGVKMISIRLSAGSVPSGHLLDKLIQTIETAEQPMLIHCRSGIDRTGMASVLAAMAIGKVDYHRAKWQAYVSPGPWKRKRKYDYVHISDMFKFYESYCCSNGLNTNNWRQFKQWAIDKRTATDIKCDMDSK